MTTVENWIDWTFNGALVGVPVTTGGSPVGGAMPYTPPEHKARLPGEATLQYVWLAAGAYKQMGAFDDWYVQVALKFFLRDRPVGSILWSDASKAAAAVWAAPKRSIMRVRADGSGSVLPVIRMQSGEGPWVRDNLDIGCVRLPIQADRVELEIEDGFVSVAGGNQTLIRTGYRILSI